MKLIEMKKGQLDPKTIGIVAAIALVIVAIILYAQNAGAMTGLDSLTPSTDSCKATYMGVRIGGEIYIEDTAFWGVEPEPVEIDVSEVRQYTPSLGITKQDYEWKVELINTRTNNVIASDSGDDTHPGGSTIQRPEYVLDFTILDNNCDDIIDDFDAKLRATVFEDGDEHTYEKLLKFRNGKYTES